MASDKKQSFLHGAALLAGATAIVKVLGALYKIPLGNIIDDAGLATLTQPTTFTPCF